MKKVTLTHGWGPGGRDPGAGGPGGLGVEGPGAQDLSSGLGDYQLLSSALFENGQHSHHPISPQLLSPWSATSKLARAQ